MRPEPENHQALLKLIALKRYEQPPPGFFHDLPQRIRARIEAAELAPAVPWHERLMARFAVKPALAAAFTLAVGGVYFFGLQLSDLAEQQSALKDQPPAEVWYGAAPGNVRPFAPGFISLPYAEDPTPPPVLSSSVAPVLEPNPQRSFFPTPMLRMDQVQRVNFSVGGSD
ncbi:MAG: hypothetical protein FJ387_03575 [Verrucomicrobia bacterium]|nr:hypothetical protein [Verrucomicrobiota bacterium]